MTPQKSALRKSERRRCRAEVTSNWSRWGAAQCSYIATTERALPPESRTLPVCGIHARARSAYEYRATGVTSLAVEAVVR